MEQHELYTPEEVAELLRVTPKTVRQYIRDGKMKAYKISRYVIRIPRQSIEYLFEKGVK